MAESDNSETWEQTAVKVSSLLSDKLQLPGVELERAHRVGQRQNDRPRPIVARFTRYCDREAAMRNAKKLRGTNIYLNDDLCAASQAIKNSQMPQMKQARAAGKIAYFRHTKLIVKDRPVIKNSSQTQQSMSEAPSDSNRDQQQDIDAGTMHGRESLHETSSDDEGAVGGPRATGDGGLERTDSLQAFPPLQPSAGHVGSILAPYSPNARTGGAAPPSRSQPSRKNADRKAKGK